MDLASLLSLLPLPHDVERLLAYATIALAAFTVLASGLDWLGPKLSDVAARMAIHAASTPGDIDDRAARLLSRLARLASQLAVIASAVVDVLRAVIPRGRVSVGKPEVTRG